MKRIIVWIRNDLRLEDHPALAQAAEDGEVLPVYLYDPTQSEGIGEAQRWWLHHSLLAFKAELALKDLPLVILQGEPLIMLRDLVKEVAATHVYFNESHLPSDSQTEEQLKWLLGKMDVGVTGFASDLLLAPGEVTNQQGNAYKVFTPFWKKVAQRTISKPIPIPKKIAPIQLGQLEKTKVEQLKLINNLSWSAKFDPYWQPGEAGAKKALEQFLTEAVEAYHRSRDFPSVKGVSMLSPHLAFGEMSSRMVWHQINEHIIQASAGEDYAEVETGAIAFLRQLAWRDFAHHQLVAHPTASTKALRPAFDHFPWLEDGLGLKAWQQGKTGYPLVDAGMRELFETGWMHNRVRMVTASFLVKHLLIDWRLGAAWFRDTLVDHNFANNVMGWQWVAGSGYDASPYFRIFNPITQGEKFDSAGDYIKRWLPELAKLPTTYLFAPWKAPKQVLEDANVILGETYPMPIVDHKTARERALQAYQVIKREGE